MNDGNCIVSFNRLTKELRCNDIFITIDEGHDFVVCEKKYSKNWRSILNRGKDDTCPIGIFTSLDEARAFAIGLVIGKKKNWKHKG